MSISSSLSNSVSASSSSTVTHTPKPWSIAIFERERSHLTNFVKDKVLHLLDDTETRRIIIRAPVKSGKRELAEYMALRDMMSGDSTRCHAFLSAWHRIADEEQRKELAEHNLKVFPITKQKDVEAYMIWNRAQIRAGKKIVNHLDECDHGSGQRQVLSKIWRQVRDNVNVTNILYSATPEEVCFSSEIDDSEHNDMMDEMVAGHRVDYIPPEGYCGPGHFLDAGLVYEAKPFFENTETSCRITEQGCEIISGLRASIESHSRRNIIILRLSYIMTTGSKDQRKENKAIYQFLRNLSKFPELEGIKIVADKGDKFNNIPGLTPQIIDWSNRNYWDLITDRHPLIYVIDQTSTRSTEWTCHDRIFATHDFRNNITFSVVSQAQERVNHYAQKYGSFQPIRVYGSLKTFQLSAGRIDYDTYLKNEWKKQKVDRRSAGGAELYKVINAATRVLHPSYPSPLSPAAADQALQALGCLGTSILSERVTGTVKTVPTIRATFHRCDRESFGALATTLVEGRTFQNPFDRSIAEMTRQGIPHTAPMLGYMRGWKVLDYDRDLNVTDPHTGIVYGAGWGFTIIPGGNDPRVTICYKDGVLGVALRVMTATRDIDRLSAYKSMYPSRNPR
uniref:Uncharacterized protein n=1 Tax=viral metagenome TaxID=1070528 RepID=A0A6C0AQ94_9ZZZZ